MQSATSRSLKTKHSLALVVAVTKISAKIAQPRLTNVGTHGITFASLALWRATTRARRIAPALVECGAERPGNTHGGRLPATYEVNTEFVHRTPFSARLTRKSKRCTRGSMSHDPKDS